MAISRTTSFSADRPVEPQEDSAETDPAIDFAALLLLPPTATQPAMPAGFVKDALPSVEDGSGPQSVAMTETFAGTPLKPEPMHTLVKTALPREPVIPASGFAIATIAGPNKAGDELATSILFQNVKPPNPKSLDLGAIDSSEPSVFAASDDRISSSLLAAEELSSLNAAASVLERVEHSQLLRGSNRSDIVPSTLGVTFPKSNDAMGKTALHPKAFDPASSHGEERTGSIGSFAEVLAATAPAKNVSAGELRLDRTDLPETEVTENGADEFAVADRKGLMILSKLDSAETIVTVKGDLQRLSAQIEPHLLNLAAATRLGREGKSMKIHLRPEELGAVEVTLVRHDNGAFSARLTAENESSRQALTDNIVQLRQSLEAAGLRLQDIEVGSRPSSFTGQGEGHGHREQSGSAHFSPDANADRGGLSEGTGENDIRLLNLRA